MAHMTCDCSLHVLEFGEYHSFLSPVQFFFFFSYPLTLAGTLAPSCYVWIERDKHWPTKKKKKSFSGFVWHSSISASRWGLFGAIRELPTRCAAPIASRRCVYIKKGKERERGKYIQLFLIVMCLLLCSYRFTTSSQSLLLSSGSVHRHPLGPHCIINARSQLASAATDEVRTRCRRCCVSFLKRSALSLQSVYTQSLRVDLHAHEIWPAREATS